MRTSLIALLAILVTSAVFAQPLTVAPHDPVTAVADTREGAIVTFEVVAYGGNDPNPTVTCDPPSGSLFPLGPTYVTCIARNSFGETATGTVYVFVYDVGYPVLHLPDDFTVIADGNDGAVVTYQATATDVIDGNIPIDCAPRSGSRFPLGTTTVQCTATDNSQNTATGSFTVDVRTNPERLIIHVPDPITAEAEGPAGAKVTFTVTAEGTSDPDPKVSCDPTSGSIFPLGGTTVNCVATDRFGNSASGQFSVTVVDTTGPTLSVPEPIFVYDAGPDGAVVTYDASATDAVDGNRPIACSPMSGSRFPVGTTEVQCSASDSRGNGSSTSFFVEVREKQQQETLMIHVPGPITTEAESPDGSTVIFTVNADGTSDPDPHVSCDPVSGSTFPLGTTTVQCVATDSNGNTASGSFDVNVVDTIDPVISSVKATPDVLSPPNNKMIPVTVTVEATDVADAMPRCFVFSVTSEESISGDVRIVSDLELELRAERDKDERTYTVHVRCVDDSANAADGSVTVKVPKGSEQSTAPPKKRRSVG